MKTSNFTDLLLNALKLFHQAEGLGKESPLAWPYFLGEYLPKSEISYQERGQALQKVFEQAWKKLDGKNKEETQLLQQLVRRTFFDLHELSQEQLSESLNLSLATYKRKREKAVDLLGESLLTLLQPSLRLESIPQLETPVERTEVTERCVGKLRKQETIALLGTSGIGKTALGTALANQWKDWRQKQFSQFSDSKTFVFWYTIRPDLNDQVESFVFALGLFAHHHGLSVLWQELVSSQGKLTAQPRREKLLEMVRYVLEELRPTPLLVIDEVDLLQSDPEHSSLVRLIESLHGVVPILLIGQRVNLVADYVEAVQSLSASGQHMLLEQRQVEISASQQQHLYQLTRGNPRLLHLFCTSLQSGLAFREILEYFAQHPTLEALFTRMVQRLLENGHRHEITILKELSVFPVPAPRHHWETAEQAPLIEQLVAFQLIQIDHNGGIEIPSVYRPLIYNNLPGSERSLLHRQAAVIRSQNGEYTAAAYHWGESNEVACALQDWEEHQTQEIAQGQAATALRLFRRMQKKSIPPDLAEKLQLLCGRLELLTGQPKQALEDIRSLLEKHSLFAIEANELAGKIHNDYSEGEEAEKRFHRALQLAEAFTETHKATARKGLAWHYMKENEVTRAEHELNLAAYEIEQMRGNIARERCQYISAIHHYQNAVHLAEEAGHQEGIANSCNEIAGILMRQGEFASAFQHLDRAYQTFEKIGKIRYMAGCCISRAVAHNLAEQHQAALDATVACEKLLQYLIRPEAHLQVALLQAQAESYLGLNDLDKACQLAHQVNQMEDKQNSRDACWVLGEAYSQLRKWNDAKNYLSLTLQLAEEDPLNIDWFIAGYAHRSFALHFKRQGQFDHAISSRDRSINIFEQINLPFEVKRTFALFDQTNMLL